MTKPLGVSVAAICDGILDAIGGSPLVRLRYLYPEFEFNVFSKIEGINPGGSLKDRPALAIISDAISRQAIRRGTTVVESSSGNMGVGLAQVCRYYSLRFVCVVDTNASLTNLRIMEALGAEIDVVREPDPETGELLTARIKRVEQLCREIDGSYWPNQYANLSNPNSHYHSTMAEIADALDGKIAVLLVPTSTCGTILGCCQFVRDKGLSTKVVAVDAVGSQIFGDKPARRRIPGLGAGIIPPLCDPSMIAECVHVTDLDCVMGCQRLLDREAIFAGGSSGGVATALAKYAPKVPSGSNCVLILPDRGERYLDTIFNPVWVEEIFGSFDRPWVEFSESRWPAATLR